VAPRTSSSNSQNTSNATTVRKPTQLMVVNDVPGEECRIAILEDGRLEELYSERSAAATGVGNIYKGRVINVEPAIQAAFIDYGASQNGFLHISDLHPRYFPDGDRTERVGKKIPRRERPPMQEALRRGDSVLVQVIKEGIGTKGPTLTSYLSIPGRLMVMMPDMDKVGVSRKIEDEEKRREMREILDSLELPDGVGFILRTAGFGRTKTELKRDLAYLKRLWTMMEKRIKGAQAPCPLYVESDLLIRTIRDVMSPDIQAIVVDSESGCERAREFLQVIAPRSAPRVIRYRRPSPIFHAFGVESQIDLIHQRVVPLPSGGAIVIDQTEAVVAIDVNSGKSRSARDSETNAYRTNCEATDEICRQLRLRDLGGLVINDMIDMVRLDHRKAIEKRFLDNLARDRAKTTVARISEFGVLEMTRQRMRPGIRKAHYQPCPHCDGRGEVRTPESMASESLRFIAYLLQFERVHAVEVVCSSRVASVFLGGRRRELDRLEDAFDKTVRIRVSETISLDRVDYYAYDDRSADIDIPKLQPPPMPRIDDLLAEDDTRITLPEGEMEDVGEGEAGESLGPQDGERGRRRRRRRGAKPVASLEATLRSPDFVAELKRVAQDELEEERLEAIEEPENPAARVEGGSDGMADESRDLDGLPGAPAAGTGEGGEGGRRRRRRRRRGGRGRGRGQGQLQQGAAKPGDALAPSLNGEAATDVTSDYETSAGDGSREDQSSDVMVGDGASPESPQSQDRSASGAGGEGAPGEGGGGRRRRRRRRGRRGGGGADGTGEPPANGRGLPDTLIAARLDGQPTQPRDLAQATGGADDSFDHGGEGEQVDHAGGEAKESMEPDATSDATTPADDGEPSRRRRRRRRRGGRGRGGQGESGATGAPSPQSSGAAAPAAAAARAPSIAAPAPSKPAPRRTLYRAFRKVSASEAGQARSASDE
jgi:ribonuclease E